MILKQRLFCHQRSTVGVRNLIKKRQKYLFRSLLTKGKTDPRGRFFLLPRNFVPNPAPCSARIGFAYRHRRYPASCVGIRPPRTKAYGSSQSLSTLAVPQFRPKRQRRLGLRRQLPRPSSDGRFFLSFGCVTTTSGRRHTSRGCLRFSEVSRLCIPRMRYLAMRGDISSPLYTCAISSYFSPSGKLCMYRTLAVPQFRDHHPMVVFSFL